jgi:hypothetical protein
MTMLTRITLTRDNTQHVIQLAYDDATVEAITDAAVELIRRHRINSGDTLTVLDVEA